MPAPPSVTGHLHGGGQLVGYTPQTLTYFPVSGNFYAIADPSVSGNLNAPIVAPVNALVTFTPRIARGQQFFITNYLIAQAYNAEQTVTLIGNSAGSPSGGTFTLSFGTSTTTALAWDIAPEDLEDALEALPNIGVGNVLVLAGISPYSYNVEFTGSLGVQPIPVLSGDADLLTNAEGEGFCEVTVAATLLGGPEIVADTSVSLPPLTCQIFNGTLCTLDAGNVPGFELVSNSSVLDNDGDLIYDVTFTQVTYNGAAQYIAPFGFTAPTDNTPIDLADPALEKLPYQKPSTTDWVPPTNVGQPLRLVTNWRQRALGNTA